LDVVINLKHPSNYSFDQGARFEIIFEKARHFYGKDAESFHVQLKANEKEVIHWDIIGAPIDPEVEAVADALKKGLTLREITENTGLSKSQVETRKEKAKKIGLIE
jgi:DNA-binding NarL/FixJ family response regulator